MNRVSIGRLPVRDQTPLHLASLLHAERRRRGTRTGSRALGCFKQAVLILRWFLDGTRMRQLARGPVGAGANRAAEAPQGRPARSERQQHDHTISSKIARIESASPVAQLIDVLRSARNNPEFRYLCENLSKITSKNFAQIGRHAVALAGVSRGLDINSMQCTRSSHFELIGPGFLKERLEGIR